MESVNSMLWLLGEGIIVDGVIGACMEDELRSTEG